MGIIPLILFFFWIPGLNTCFGDSFANDNHKSHLQIITNPENPVPKKGKCKKLIFTEELTIGSEEGDKHILFGDNIQVTADDEGFIYVLNWDEKCILKYDAAGKYLLTRQT
ncbi:MAG: hypothetical protein JXB26_00810 [Candidatus Aminicenantes bacterium]|nr:hypothetical protein [Candidatus Aminicenantes bacterium]